MGTLESAERMIASPIQGRFVSVQLRREDNSGLVFISCNDLPELFVAVKSEQDIRLAIDDSLKSAFSKSGRRVQVYTNGKIIGPSIDAAVFLTEAL